MINPIKQIYAFNHKAGLLDQGYSDKRECAFPIEEALEGFDLSDLSLSLDIKVQDSQSPKAISRQIMAETLPFNDMTDVDRLDKHLDIIVFSFGSIFKLGLNPQQAMKALSVVMNANMQKLNAGKDEHGKQLKPEGFVGPEAELLKILDQRENLD